MYESLADKSWDLSAIFWVEIGKPFRVDEWSMSGVIANLVKFGTKLITGFFKIISSKV